MLLCFRKFAQKPEFSLEVPHAHRVLKLTQRHRSLHFPDVWHFELPLVGEVLLRFGALNYKLNLLVARVWLSAVLV
jgi:hypothetical protein